jgi:hypothetical protein
MGEARSLSLSALDGILQFVPTKMTLHVEAPSPRYVQFGAFGSQEHLALMLTVICRCHGLEEVFVLLKRNNEWLSLLVPNETDKRAMTLESQQVLSAQAIEGPVATVSL